MHKPTMISPTVSDDDINKMYEVQSSSIRNVYIAEYWFKLQDQAFFNFWCYRQLRYACTFWILLLILEGPGELSFACWHADPTQHVHEAIMGSWDACHTQILLLLTKPSCLLSDWMDNEAINMKKIHFMRGSLAFFWQTKHANFPSIGKILLTGQFLTNLLQNLNKCLT